MSEPLGKRLKLWLKELEEEKRYYEDKLYDIARFVNPRRELIKDSQRYDDRGAARGKDSYSGVPNSALSVWADGMQGHMVSQSLKWFKSVLDDPKINAVDEVQKYLQEYDEAMYGEFNRSNFYAVLHEWFRDAGSVGTAPLYTEEDIATGTAIHIPMHIREIFIAENMYGEVDTVFRKFSLTARQAVEKFGIDKLHESIVNNAKEHPEKKHNFIHAVFPNKDRVYGNILAENKKFASIYMQEQEKIGVEDGLIIKRSGYDINPYAVWRLRKNSDEIYGYSPAADALVEIKQLNQMSKTLLKAAHMAVSPALNVPEQMRGNTRIEPDGLNYYERGGDTIKPVHTGVQYPIGIDREEKAQRIIEDKYRVEFFLILARAEREMTATEIMERQAEKAVLLGPQVDRLIREGLSKVFEIQADIAEKGGRLPEPPQILIDAIEESRVYGKKETEIAIRFIGPLAQAQRRLFQMQPIKNGLAEISQASVLFPKVLDRVDPDKLAELILDSTDFPQSVMRTDDGIGEMRKQEAQQMAQQQAMQQAAAMADAVPKLQKKTEQGSPLEAIGAQLGM